MALFTSISSTPVSVSVPIRRRLINGRRSLLLFASLSPSESSPSAPAATSSNNEAAVSSAKTPPSKLSVESSRQHDPSFKYAMANPTGADSHVGIFRSTESIIERLIFDFRFLALLAVGGSLAGSLLCFLNGCINIVDAYKVYWTSCVNGIHTGKMVLRLVEAIGEILRVHMNNFIDLVNYLRLSGWDSHVDFGMGLYGLFISNVPPDVAPDVDRALKGSSLFGMFSLKTRPKWMKISSLDELKTKVGHVIVMILLVKMFERSKMVTIATGMDLLSYSICIFLSSASLYILHHLHKPEAE